MEKHKRPQYSRRPRTPDGSHSGATKFDKWLRARMVAKEGVIVVLKTQFYPVLEEDEILRDCEFRATVVEVDRYAVALEFTDYISAQDGATWWVMKDQIRAVSVGFSD